jgi:hypothetical protein
MEAKSILCSATPTTGLRTPSRRCRLPRSLVERGSRVSPKRLIAVTLGADDEVIRLAFFDVGKGDSQPRMADSAIRRAYRARGEL